MHQIERINQKENVSFQDDTLTYIYLKIRLNTEQVNLKDEARP